MYMVQRGQLFWFSRQLKLLAGRLIHLASGSHAVGKNGYLRFSLGTGNRREAERLARRFAVEVDNALERRDRDLKVADQPITPDDIQLASANMLSTLLAADESVHAAAIESVLSGNEIERSPDRESCLANELPPPGVIGDAQLLLKLRAMIPFYMLQATGKVPEGLVDAQYVPFATAFRQYIASLDGRAAGKFIPTPPIPKPVTNISAISSTWDELLEYYFKHHDDLSDSTVALYRLVTRSLASATQCPPADITRAQVVGWRDQLLTEVKSKKTAMTRLYAGHTIYGYGLVNERLGDRRDPFTGVTVAGGKTEKSSRKEFSLDSLKEVFRDPPDLADIPASAGKHAALWVPLLSLYTGARREEIAGLLTEEVGEFGKIIYIHFKDNKFRKLKKDSCERKTPMHSQLIRLGFTAYVAVVRAAGAERLFPGIVNSDGLADWFIPRVKSRIGDLGYKQDIHSLRHTIKTAARDVPLAQEIHDAITGHKTAGVSGDYGSPAGVKTLKRELDKIKFPGVFLTPPPVPTIDEIEAQMACAERRRIAGESRRKQASSE